MRKVKKDEKPKNPIHLPMKKAYDEWLLKEKGISKYVWDGMECKYINLIYAKLRVLFDGCNLDDDAMLESWRKLLSAVSSDKKWLLAERFTLKCINTDFNQISGILQSKKQAGGGDYSSMKMGILQKLQNDGK